MEVKRFHLIHIWELMFGVIINWRLLQSRYQGAQCEMVNNVAQVCFLPEAKELILKLKPPNS
jgi:hypothetical protein